MLERESDSLERVMTNELGNTLLSYRYFKTAMSLAMAQNSEVSLAGSKEPYYCVMSLVDIARARNEVGQDPSYTLDLSMDAAMEYLSDTPIESRIDGLLGNLGINSRKRSEWRTDRDFRCFYEIGRAQMEAGSSPKEAYQYALQVRRYGWDGLKQLSKLASTQADAGLISDAEETTDFLRQETKRIYSNLNDPQQVEYLEMPFREDAYASIAVAFEKQGQQEEADQVLGRIITNFGLARAYYQMALVTINDSRRESLLNTAAGYASNIGEDPRELVGGNRGGLDTAKFQAEIANSILDFNPQLLPDVMEYIHKIIANKEKRVPERRLPDGWRDENGRQVFALMLVRKGLFKEADEISKGVSLLERKVIKLAQDGNVSAALAIFDDVEERYRRSYPYIKIAESQINRGEDPSSTLELAELYCRGDNRYRSLSLVSVAIGWAKAAEIARAEELARQIDSYEAGIVKEDIFLEIANVYIKKGDVVGVKRMLDQISDIRRKIKVYISLGSFYARTGMNQDKIFLLSEDTKNQIRNMGDETAIEAIHIFGSVPPTDEQIMSRIKPLFLAA